MREVSRYNSVALVGSAVIKPAPGKLLFLNVGTTLTTDHWLHIYDSATVPAEAAIPAMSIPVAASSTGKTNISLGGIPASGIPFSAGIAVAHSSTNATKTIIGTSNLFITACYA